MYPGASSKKATTNQTVLSRRETLNKRIFIAEYGSMLDFAQRFIKAVTLSPYQAWTPWSLKHVVSYCQNRLQLSSAQISRLFLI